ncbi:hypothetical protein ACC807_22595 [Rhizobium ruizarguesonis]|nr:hypothetical protein [Rhizobium ruizarguesonis]MBY5879557.1 hypothetical protein [Rhizobium leguminosarum]TBY93370.1 hypothetical protein E0H40_05895 [Rhizobium leguminosarum bv. viciae]WSH19326.1 hypothetical protein U8Q07_16435 [Rhizobium ruizarguesonis]
MAVFIVDVTLTNLGDKFEEEFNTWSIPDKGNGPRNRRRSYICLFINPTARLDSEGAATGAWRVGSVEE